MSLGNWGNSFVGSGQDDYVNTAANRARQQYDANMASLVRQAGRMGINPNSGAFMNMLYNAQYDRTAGINAAANEADAQYLSAAQKQFNADRDYALDWRRQDDANSHFWAEYNARQNTEKAKYIGDRAYYRRMNRLREEANPPHAPIFNHGPSSFK